MTLDIQAIKARRAAISRWVEETQARESTAYRPSDAAFIAAAPADIDALLAEVERLTAELAGYQRNAAYISSIVDSEGVYIP